MPRWRLPPGRHTEMASSRTGISIKLVGEDGNAFSILGRCRQALEENHKESLWPEFVKSATASDYTNLLVVVMDWFDVE